MSNIIKVIGFDPSMSNFGVAQCTVDLSTDEISVTNLILIGTKGESNKGVIKVSDDLRRAREVFAGMTDACKGYSLAISEIPLGNAAVYNNAILSAGLVTGVLGGCPIPIIQVFPQDVKMVATGARNGDKAQVIDWAMSLYPNANWLTRKRGGKLVPIAANEHLADAIAAVHAGVRTQQFKQAAAIYRSMQG